ncbi:MAG: threonine synthase [Bacteroides sp. SM23_62_1]|nr:MAG: threonine synthase [Bacteroides sp. SM23_62_1]
MNEWLNTTPYALIDGAISNQPALSRETQQLKSIVLDSEISLLERLEAYEEIINIEVGDTSLSRARNLERETDIKQIYLKFEGGNPTGTQKDRIAFTQCLDALRREFDSITAATCGNYGVSLALAANLAGLRCIICIPEEYQTKRLPEIQDLGSEIVRTPGSYEDSVEYSKQIAQENQYYDANPGGANTHLQLVSYSEIANEIYDILRDAPRVVSAPVSNGTLLAGIYRGFVTLYKRGKTSRIPRIVAGSSYRKNPIIVSFKSGLDSCKDIDKTLIRETAVNEPLINWHSFDGDEALTAIRQTEGWAEDISDMKLIKTSKHLMEKEGLNVLPASTAGLIAFLKKATAENFENDRYVAILTGRK